MKQTTTYEKIRDSGICYMIISRQYKMLTNFGKDYSIVIFAPDKKLFRIKEMTKAKNIFLQSLEKKDLLECIMNEDEISQFKADSSLYKKVQHTDEGRIYEQKHRSFKSYYDSLLQPFESDLENFNL